VQCLASPTGAGSSRGQTWPEQRDVSAGGNGSARIVPVSAAAVVSFGVDGVWVGHGWVGMG